MRITDLSVDGFGVWHELHLRRLSPELTVFYGLNEAGKTTLMQFLRSMLYGVSPERRQIYLPPLEGGRPGGTLGVQSEEGSFQLSRYADRGEEDIGRVTVTLHDGTQQGDRLLREELEHVDEATFNNIFAVGLDEIQHLGTLGGSQAAEWIYRLTSGLDRISLYDVIVGLRESQRRLLGDDQRSSVMAQLLTTKERLESEIAELADQTRIWCVKGVELEETSAESRRWREELRQRELQARRYEVALGIRPQWTKREQVEQRMEQLAHLYPLEKSALTDLEELNDRVEEHLRQSDILRGQRQQLRQEVEELGINEVLMQNNCRVEGLAEQQEWLESLAEQAEEQRIEAERLAARFEADTNRLAEQWFGDPERRLVLSAEQMEKLTPQRTAMEEAEQRFQQAEVAYQDYRGEEEKFRLQLESATASGEQFGLPTDLHEAGELVAKLRRRLQVEQRIEQTRRSGVELEEQARDILDGQVMPLRFYLLSVLAFFVGVVFLAMWAMTDQGSSWGQGGLILTLVGILTPLVRWVNESRAADELDDVHRQIETLNRQLAEAQEQKKVLDQELSVTEGSVVLRLQTAEKHLAELEAMVPVESERRRATEASRIAERDYQSAREKLSTAQQDWRRQLKALGLPHELTPQELNLLAGQYEELAQLEAKAQRGMDDVKRRQREFERVVDRIERLAQETDLVLDDAEPLEQLEHLVSECRLQHSLIERREKLTAKAKELKSEEGRHRQAATSLERKREAMFHKAGVEHETAFRQLAADLAERERLDEQRASLTREITAAIGSLGEEEDFAPLLAPETIGRLEVEWEGLLAAHEQVETKLEQLQARRAQLIEQRRQLAEDTTLANKQIELSTIEAELAEAIDRWRERAAVGRLLEHVRQEYEQHRQPETLLEATEYFRELTGGHYTRVWTPLANDTLFIDRADGVSLAIDSLSRGTREQLFLSVRLALVAMFARRGIQLPMILDDVLVNYDEQRAATAAKVLCRFAGQGHQLLIFTCHEHILTIFKKLGTDCRRLPRRTGEPERLVEESVEEEPVADEVVEPEVMDEEIPEPEPEEIEEEVLKEEEEDNDQLVEEEPLPVTFAYDCDVAPRPEPPLEPPPAQPVAVEYDWKHDDAFYRQPVEARDSAGMLPQRSAYARFEDPDLERQELLENRLDLPMREWQED